MMHNFGETSVYYIMNKIYLVRHGETYWNVEGRIQGQTQTELTHKGKEQAHWLAEYFKSKAIQSIICSNLARSLKTAEQINKYHRLSLEVNSDINECNWGKWEGLTHFELLYKFPDEYKSREKNIWFFRPENGESYDDLYHRLILTATELANRSVNENLIVVGHAMVNKVLLGIFLDLLPQKTIALYHPNNIIYLIWQLNSLWNTGYIDHNGVFYKGYIKSKEI